MFYSKNIRTARDLRQHLVNRKAPEPCAKGFWNRKFPVDLDKNFWSISFRATKETRHRVLHWKILHNIYPTNILLCKMKVKENNKCTYCNEFCRLYWTFLLWMSCCSRFLTIHWTAYLKNCSDVSHTVEWNVMARTIPISDHPCDWGWHTTSGLAWLGPCPGMLCEHTRSFPPLRTQFVVVESINHLLIVAFEWVSGDWLVHTCVCCVYT